MLLSTQAKMSTVRKVYVDPLNLPRDITELYTVWTLEQRWWGWGFKLSEPRGPSSQYTVCLGLVAPKNYTNMPENAQFFALSKTTAVMVNRSDNAV